ncbi:hypothetical protein CYMTET_24393 [Cymbomonas tetramitiformis]|uniref:Uncharacterized protein n=1 Tax=Cymbomonas tetramitiformis TaxID=36881 RepID=A0AAE0FWN4_9CHLO|nr:hypothetical protein CYMTET_24393 [Cymbomonas tetramitiformis]
MGEDESTKLCKTASRTCNSRERRRREVEGPIACEDFNPILNVQAQHAVYVDLVVKVPKESGHDIQHDSTIAPYIQNKIRNDVCNFRSLWRCGRWLKVSKEEYELTPPTNHPYSKVEEVKSLRIKTLNDRENLAALKAAGI